MNPNTYKNVYKKKSQRKKRRSRLKCLGGEAVTGLDGSDYENLFLNRLKQRQSVNIDDLQINYQNDGSGIYEVVDNSSEKKWQIVTNPDGTQDVHHTDLSGKHIFNIHLQKDETTGYITETLTKSNSQPNLISINQYNEMGNMVNSETVIVRHNLGKITVTESNGPMTEYASDVTTSPLEHTIATDGTVTVTGKAITTTVTHPGSITKQVTTPTVTAQDGTSTVTVTAKDGTSTVTVTAKDGTSTVIVNGQDGSVTKTVTKEVTALDGTVTTTVTAKDGTSTVTVTSLDGSVTKEVTALDGSVTKEVTALDGTVTTTVTAKDGTSTVTVTALDGSFTTTVIDSNGTNFVTAKDGSVTVTTTDGTVTEYIPTDATANPINTTIVDGKVNVDAANGTYTKIVREPYGTITITDPEGNVNISNDKSVTTNASTEASPDASTDASPDASTDASPDTIANTTPESGSASTGESDFLIYANSIVPVLGIIYLIHRMIMAISMYTDAKNKGQYEKLNTFLKGKKPQLAETSFNKITKMWHYTMKTKIPIVDYSEDLIKSYIEASFKAAKGEIQIPYIKLFYNPKTQLDTLKTNVIDYYISRANMIDDLEKEINNIDRLYLTRTKSRGGEINLSITQKIRKMTTLLPSTWTKENTNIKPNSIVAIGTFVYKNIVAKRKGFRFRDVLKLFCVAYDAKSRMFVVYCKSVPFFTFLRLYEVGITKLYKTIFDSKFVLFRRKKDSIPSPSKKNSIQSPSKKKSIQSPSKKKSIQSPSKKNSIQSPDKKNSIPSPSKKKSKNPYKTRRYRSLLTKKRHG